MTGLDAIGYAFAFLIFAAGVFLIIAIIVYARQQAAIHRQIRPGKTIPKATKIDLGGDQ